MTADERYMKMALEEARVALAQDEIPVGAVVVAHGQVVGRGHNLTETLHDVTAHAEMQAITAAAETLGGKYLTGCTLYVTVEPCVMCAGAIGWSQLGRLVYGAGDEKRGFKKFGHNDIGALKEGKERGVLATAKDSSAVYRMESSGIYKVIYSYGWYLKKMIRDAQEKGAIPVLLSLTPRNEWHEGNGHSRGFVYPVNEKAGKLYIERRNETFGTWCRSIARETGCEFVDIHNITADALDKMGPKKAAAYFKNDHTHTSLIGARLNAQSLAKGLRDIQSPVAWLLK